MTILKTESILKYNAVHSSAENPHVDYEKLPFHDKATYLEWRAVWRAAYADLSAHIRMLKPLRKSKRETYSPDAQSAVASYRHKASLMMDQRALSKQKAAKQYVRVNRVSHNDLVDATALAMASI